MRISGNDIPCETWRVPYSVNSTRAGLAIFRLTTPTDCVPKPDSSVFMEHYDTQLRVKSTYLYQEI